jgi:hypothetical protein
MKLASSATQITSQFSLLQSTELMNARNNYSYQKNVDYEKVCFGTT